MTVQLLAPVVDPDRRGWLWMMYALAIAQGLFFALTGASPLRRAIGIALAILMILEAWRPWLVGSGRLASAGFLSVALGTNFLAHLIQSPPPFSFRPVQVGVTIGYMALLGSAATMLAPHGVRRVLHGIVGVVAAAVTLGELALEGAPKDFVEGRVVWDGSPGPDIQTRETYPPHGVFRTQFPDDPRDYFDDIDARQASWQLDVHNAQSQARLEFPIERGGQMRVVIDRLADTTWWGVQLNQTPLPFIRSRSYVLKFQARASRPRTIAVAVSQGHPPWDGLGYSREVVLDTTWRRFEERFSVQSDDSVGRLHFDVGRDSATIDLAGISVHRDDGQEIVLVRKAHPAVSYRFNSLGCRGPNGASQDPDSTTGKRILVVGDSYAMGIGVHEQDTFAALLPARLAVDSRAEHVSVLNCGAVGSGPRESRHRYDRVAAMFNPDIVLLVMGRPRERTWGEEQAWAKNAGHTKFRYLFRTSRLLSEGRMEPVDTSVAGFVTGVVGLAEAAVREGRYVGVVLFDHPDLMTWRYYRDAIQNRLKSRGIAVLDLSTTLRRLAPRWRDLSVHPVFDAHAGPAAHEAAAGAIADLLRKDAFPSSRPRP